ncbi:MAG: tryptophan--tRNA ligase, partial [Calditrichia bacterium]|nr:tryptophan--tRNA ligase [Calditrichia bacterium]
KMSKSLNNAIFLSETPDEIFQKVRRAITDPQKVRKNDPGHPEVCNIFAYHQKFNKEEIPEIEKDCKSGILGCVACKQNCANKISDYLAPIREKRVMYEKDMDLVKDIINNGNKKAREEAQKTMADVYKAMKIG